MARQTGVQDPPFGTLLKRYRVAAGLSQEALAERAGMSARGISDLERGARRAPYRDTVSRLAAALGLDEPERATLEQAVARLRSTPPRTDPDAEAVGTGLPMVRSGSLTVGATRILSSLPAEPTSFIGRQREIEALSHLLQQSDVRLLTLLGPGGIGKTRLALRAGSEVTGRFERVVFVPLAALSSPDLVPAAIGRALGVPDVQGRLTIQALAEHLRRRETLLILDNVEHLLEAGPAVAELISICPNLKVLATSRAVLHLAAEHVFAVPPLDSPDPRALPPVDALLRYDAVALFVARARARRADFALTPENAAAVVAICRHLDGLPLAIELAAARIHVLPPQALLGRLSQRLPLLTGGARDLPERQQTLRATIDWSYQLLTQCEQTLFARLSVFHGGCGLEAVQAVCMPDDEAIVVLEGMTSLVEKSLLQQVDSRNDEPRFALLETIREYARERLVDAGDLDTVQRRHAEYFTQLVERVSGTLWAAWLYQGDSIDAFWQLEAERYNLDAALHWVVESGEAALGLRLAGALHYPWHELGHWAELPGALECLLTTEAEVPPAVRARALLASAAISADLGDVERSNRRFDEGIALCRQIGDKRALLEALLNGSYGPFAVDPARAEALHTESLALGRELGASGAIGMSLRGLGFAMQIRGNLERARAFFEESLAMERESGNRLGMAYSLHALAWLALLEGNAGQAREVAGPCVELYQASAAFHDLANLRTLLGIAALLQGDHPALYALFRQEAADGHLDRFDKQVSDWLWLVAAAAATDGDVQCAARLLGALESTGSRIEETMLAHYHDALAQRLSEARRRSSEPAWQSVWQEGQSMTLHQAVICALRRSNLGQSPGRGVQ